MSAIDPASVELGLDTFGDVTVDADGQPRAQRRQVLRNVVEEAVLADQVGLDFIGRRRASPRGLRDLGPRGACSPRSPARTERIRLGIAVTVLSSDDPCASSSGSRRSTRVSGGRAEVIVGRGSFTESFPLFGFDARPVRAALRGEARPVRRSCSRSSRSRGRADPRAADTTSASSRPPSRAGARGSASAARPQSVVRAAHYGLPLMLAIIGGQPARFAPFANLYRDAPRGRSAAEPLPVGVHSPGYVADTDEQAREELFGTTRRMHDRIGASAAGRRSRRAQFERDARARRRAVRRLARDRRPQDRERHLQALGVSRFDLKYSQRHDAAPTS